MQFVLLLALSLVACGYAAVEVEFGYHEKVGIPTAMKIKATEDAIIANEHMGERIVGGEISAANEHPYLAGLLVNLLHHQGTSVCGAALISDQIVVTSARCWNDGRLQAWRFVAVLGSRFLFSGGDRIPSSKVITHPKWNPKTFENNIAIVKLNHKANLGVNIKPIALANEHTGTLYGHLAVASGYGKTCDSLTSVSAYSLVNRVDLKVITNLKCHGVYGNYVHGSNICTSGEGGVGVCAGDLGGPLVTNEHGKRTLVGIGSFVSGKGCQAGYPSVFTRVSSYYGFIKQYL